MSLFVNTPDSDNQLVRSALHAWTVFRLTCSLHRVHCWNPLKLTLFRNIHSWICATQHLHARTSVTSYTSVNIYNFNSRLAHLNGIYTFASNWNHDGISRDVHFAGHLRSNRTNIWSDKRNIQNMQSRGARGLELRTTALEGDLWAHCSLLSP